MDKTFSIQGAASLENIKVMFMLQQTFNLPISIEQKEIVVGDLYEYVAKSDNISAFKLEWFIDTAETIYEMQKSE